MTRPVYKYYKCTACSAKVKVNINDPKSKRCVRCDISEIEYELWPTLFRAKPKYHGDTGYDKN